MFTIFTQSSLQPLTLISNFLNSILAVPKTGDTVIDNLVDTYVDKERLLVRGVSELRLEASRFKAAYRKLYDKYRSALDLIEENAPTFYPAEHQIVLEKELLSTVKV